MSEHYPPLSPRGEHEEFESSRDLPDKNRRAFNKTIQDANQELVQVETKPGSTWTEPEQKIREPRVRQNPPAAVDTGPSVQVETGDSAEVKPQQATATRLELTPELTTDEWNERNDLYERLYNAYGGRNNVPAGIKEELAIPDHFFTTSFSTTERRKALQEMEAFVAKTETEKSSEASARAELAQVERKVDSVEKGQSLTTEEVKHMLEEQLKNNPDVLNITNVKVDEEDGGLRMNVAITTAGGKATINGLVVNDVSGLSMRDLDVDANLLIRGRVKNAFSDFSSVIKSQLEKQYGKPISSIQIGKSGVSIEFEAPVAGTAPDDKIEPILKSVHEQQDDRVDFMARQADLLDELNAKYPGGIPQHIHKELLDLGSRYIGNRESGADPSVEAQIRADRESFMASEGVRFAIEEHQSFENRKKFLNGRNNELGTKAKEYGLKFAEFIGKQAESYNKLKWYNKLLITGGLMTVASLTSAIPILSGVTAGVLYGQRALGSIGFAMNRRRAFDAKIKADPKHWLANKSELGKNLLVGMLALAYMEATSIAAHAGVAELNKLGVNEWLGNMLGYNTAPPTPEVISAPPSIAASGAFQSPIAETPATAHLAEVPVATPQAEAVAPVAEPAAAAEMTARESRETLRDLVGKITELTEEKLSSFEMPKHADFTYHGDDDSLATDLDYDVTPTDQSGEDDMLSAAEEIEEHAQPAETVTETPIPSAETFAPPIEQNLPDVETPETSAPITEPEEIVIKQPTGAPMIDVTVEQPTPEVTTEASAPAQEIVTNSFGLEVPTTESHVYSGSGDRLYVFGGTTADHSKTIREFFSETENAKKILYTPPVAGGSHVIGWIKSPDGAIMSTGPLEAEERNWFGMRKYVEKIDPNWLRKLIK